MFFLNTSVAEIASGLSTYTGTFIIFSYFLANSGSFFPKSSFNLSSSYNISCVLPTAKDGIITLPPLSKVSETISKNIFAFSSFFTCNLFPYVDSIIK